MGLDHSLIKMIDDSAVVSFDIFDTLVIRDYYSPTDLFLHIEEKYSLSNFREKRIEAEKIARDENKGKGINEVTLDEIYDKIPEFNKCKEYEIELELKHTFQNEEMYAYYDYSKKSGKIVCFSSDMYLPRVIVDKILLNCGYENYELLLSSETKRPKSTGEMYQDIINQYNVDPEKIIHIGDNPYTDNAVPESYHIKHYLCTRQRKKAELLHDGLFSCLRKTDSPVASALLERLICSKQQTSKGSDYWYLFGYNYAGIVAYAYVNWLHDEITKNNIEKVVFLMRDSYIIKKVWDILYPEDDNDLMYASRVMFTLPLLTDDSELSEIIEHDPNVFRGNTVRSILKRYMLDDCLLTSDEIIDINLDDNITDLSQIDKIVQFFETKKDYLKKEGIDERNTLIEYFEKLGLFDKKVAFVDLGWKSSIVKKIIKICEIENKKIDGYAYFLGTHPHVHSIFQEGSFMLSDGKSSNILEETLNHPYVVAILELAFSAPFPSCRKIMKNEKNGFVPISQEIFDEEQYRLDISDKICSGVIDFIGDLEKSELVDLNCKNIAYGPLLYFATSITKYDEMKLYGVKYVYGLGNDSVYHPLSKQVFARFGIINPWPGEMSGESEAVIRAKMAADNIGVKLLLLDNYGCVLDDNQQRTKEYVDPKSLDFVIAVHYLTHKTLDSFYYYTIWNPPEIPLNLDDYPGYVGNNILSYDDYLIYDSGGMSDHLRTMLINKPRDLDNTSTLVASFPITTMKKPSLGSELKLFYCGMNWEKVVSGFSTRHTGLFKLLDDTNCVEFYGPDKAWGNVRPWEGYNCYKGSIPFDGVSILEKINNCGICLVLSSDIHRRAGAVTNRLYEACAAGAVIISDNNEFVKKYFSDAALFINYNKNDPEDTFKQIMEKYRWIVENRDEAIKMVEKAQSIFREKFAMEKLLNDLINNHSSRFESVSKSLFAINEEGLVLVTYVLNTLEPGIAYDNIKHVIDNCSNQYYRNIILVVAIDESLYSELLKMQSLYPRLMLYPTKLFDDKKSRMKTDGQVIRSIQNRIDHDYYINTNANEKWYYDHITTMIRSLEDEPECVCAYSGTSQHESNGKINTNFFDTYGIKDCNDMAYLLPPGQFLFKAETHKLIPDYVFSNIDGLEHNVYLNFIMIRCNKKVVFSKRLTLLQEDEIDKRYSVISTPMQIRLIRDLTRFELKKYCSNNVIINNYTGKNEGKLFKNSVSLAHSYFKKAMVKLFPDEKYPGFIIIPYNYVKSVWNKIL